MVGLPGTMYTIKSVKFRQQIRAGSLEQRGEQKKGIWMGWRDGALRKSEEENKHDYQDKENGRRQVKIV